MAKELLSLLVLLATPLAIGAWLKINFRATVILTASTAIAGVILYYPCKYLLAKLITLPQTAVANPPNYFKSPTIDPWNEAYNEELDRAHAFDIFKNLPWAAGQNPPDIYARFAASERAWRVRLHNPQNPLEWKNVDLYVKGFYKPLSENSFRIRAFTWDNPATEHRSDSRLSPADTYYKVLGKIFTPTTQQQV